MVQHRTTVQRNSWSETSQRRAQRAAQEERASEKKGPVTLRGLVGVHTRKGALPPQYVRASVSGPAYTLAPEPMTEAPILDSKGRPRSVWSALLTLDRRAYVRLVQLAYPGTSAGDAAMTLADTLLSDAVGLGRWEQGEGCHWVWMTAQGSARVQVWP